MKEFKINDYLSLKFERNNSILGPNSWTILDQMKVSKEY